MTNSQQLRESMWDFVYGLLSDEEKQALIARIKSDPDIARLYAEVELQAELVGLASRVEDSSIVLSPASASAAAPKTAQQKAAGRRAAIGSNADSHRSGAWLAGIGMTALAALLAVGFLWPRPSERELAQYFVAADVTAAQPIQAGLSNQLAVRTYLVSSDRQSDQEAAASVELRLVDQTGQERFRTSVSTGENGRATVDIPGNVLEPGVRLELAAARATADNSAVNLADREAEVRDGATSLALGQTAVELSVNPEPQLSYVLVSEPNVDAAHAAQFSVWNFAAFSVTPESPTEQLSVAAGLPGQANGAVRLLADEVNKSVPTQAAPIKDKARLIAANEPVTLTIPRDLAGKSLAFAATCRGVTVATTASPQSVPASKDATGQALPSTDQLSLTLPPEADGLIEIEFFDRSLGESAPVHREQVYREPARRLQIDLPSAAERYAPGQEVELALRVTDERGQPAANTRLGVRVWNERALQKADEQPVLLAEAVRSGASWLENLSADATQQGQRAEHAKVDSYRFGLAPAAAADAAAISTAKPAVGERLQEQTKYAKAVARAAPIELASNREAMQAALRDAVDRASAQRQRMTEIIGGAAIFGAIALLVLMGIFAVLRMSASVKAVAPALLAAAASLLVGLVWVGWLPQPSFKQIAVARAPAATASASLNEASDATQEAAGATQPSGSVRRELAEPMNAPTEAAGAEGLSLAATPAAPPADSSLGLSRADSQLGGRAAARSAGVAPEASAASRGGEALSRLGRSNSEKKAEELATSPPAGAPGAAGGFSAGRLAAGGAEAAPKAQVRARAAGEAVEAGAKEAREALADKKSGADAAPSSLYFNPQLMTDANGLATIRFTMPPVDSEYRVLIDALGQGRIGSRQAVIVSSGTPAAAK